MHVAEDSLEFLLSSCFELSSEDRNKISYSKHRDYGEVNPPDAGNTDSSVR